MSWLDPTRVLPLAGYDPTHPLAAHALAYARTLIAARTSAVWGASQAATLRVRLESNSFLLPVPRDISAATITSPASYAGQAVTITRHGLELADGGRFDAGLYLLSVTRGYSVVPEDVVKAASLLAAHYLQLSDPDRSRYENLSFGDFAGAMRLTALPVPEAEQLLRPYCRDVAVSL